MEHERNYEDKKVTVYFKIEDDELILVTASAPAVPTGPSSTGRTGGERTQHEALDERAERLHI